jgi:hypothetical protein
MPDIDTRARAGAVPTRRPITPAVPQTRGHGAHATTELEARSRSARPQPVEDGRKRPIVAEVAELHRIY